MHSRLAVFLILVISLAAIFSSVAFYLTTPQPSQSFMGMGVFSRAGLLDYVPASNSTVSVGESMNWTLSITNRMGTAQFAEIIVRLENSTMRSPTSAAPGGNPFDIATPERFIGDGDTSNITFSWTVQSTNQTAGLVYLDITVNGLPSPVASSTGALSGEGFRWIFELWTYASCGSSLSNGCFHYGFGPETSPTGTWLQVWFNVAS
jgi:hypothetical protein